MRVLHVLDAGAALACVLWLCGAIGVLGASQPTAMHWAFSPLRPSNDLLKQFHEEHPELGSAQVSNPIDLFIRAGLAGKGLKPTPASDRQTWIRRLTFDLTGLPPRPEEVDAYVADRRPDADTRLVERLLASPHYGERWGRHWLDVVRYTESQGFEYDRLRDNAWHYRDYVIRSFNHDKPYDVFMREQIAGDVLEPVTADGIVATSLLVCGPWDEAGNAQANATQRAVTREEEMEDLVGVVGQSFLGLTVNCARCHSHKFDPIPQEEYYRVRAVFDGVKHGERPIETAAQRISREERLRGVKLELEGARRRIAEIEEQAAAKLTSLPTREAPPAGPRPLASWGFEAEALRHTGLGGGLQGGARIRNGRLELSGDGAFLLSEPLSQDIREKTLEAWVSLETLDQGGGAVISLETNGGQVFDAIVFGEQQPRRWTAGSNGFERTRSLDGPEEMATSPTWVHVAAVFASDNSVTFYRNGKPHGRAYTPGSSLQTYRRGEARVLLGMRHTGGGKAFLKGAIKYAALHDRALSAAEVERSFHAQGIVPPIEQVIAALTSTQRVSRSALTEEVVRLTRLEQSLARAPVSYVGMRVTPPPARRLRRGDVKSPEETVSPAGLSLVNSSGADLQLAPDAPEAERRIRFARWLADRNNPLPARVMVNRIWQQHFGVGLAATPNDFGVNGSRPTHPLLLDWLAARFMEAGWSIKSVHRWIVNSETYRQGSGERLSAADFAQAMSLDADNALLWRFAPRRLEAEAVRDAMLAASGQLNLAMEGPSFRPFEVLSFPVNAYRPIDRVGPEYQRRTVYRMNVNSGKEPLLDAFDCPDPSVKTPRRGVTTTPLQALGLMNNPFVQRQSMALAQRLESFTGAGKGTEGALREAYRIVLGRAASADEVQRGMALVRDRGLPAFCWALLNATEFVYVR